MRLGDRALRIVSKLAAAVLLTTVGAVAHAQSTVTGGLLVKLAPGAVIGDIANSYGLTIVGQLGARNLYELTTPAPAVIGQLITALDQDVRVVYAEPEAAVALTEVYGNPFILAWDANINAGGYVNQGAYAQVDAGTIKQYGPGKAVIAAVLDTGVDCNHTALCGRLVPGYNFVNPGQQPLDLPDGTTNAALGHGTMIAGLIAKVSPNSNIMPLRVLNADGQGTLMSVIKALHFAVLKGAAVVNMSFGSSVDSHSLREALDEANAAGVVLVASAGNDGTAAPHYPAAYNTVIGVGSVEANNVLSTFSNFGADISVVAPGSGIRSTYWNGGYATWSGTSFSAPFVAAEAAEISVIHPQWTSAHITRRILKTSTSVDALNPGFAGQLGAGIIDIQAALKRGSDDDGDDD